MDNPLELYEMCRPFMQTGDMLSWRTSAPVGWMIRKITNSDINHVGMVIRFMNYDTTRIFTLEALSGGIVLRTVRNRLENHSGQCWWHQLHPDHHNKRFTMGKEALKYIDVKYDFESIFKQIFGRVSFNAYKMFCSEYYQAIVTEVGIIEPTKKAYQPKHYNDMDFLISRKPLLYYN